MDWVFQTYVYWFDVGSYDRLLFPAATVCSMVSTGAELLHVIGPDPGTPPAKMFNPKLPPKLNFTGIALPALTELTTGRLSTGWKNPVKPYFGVSKSLTGTNS